MVDVAAVAACAALVGQHGATLTITWTCPHVPGALPGHDCCARTWSATATYRGGRRITDGHPTEAAAAMALAELILTGARCRCGRAVTLTADTLGCRWRLAGNRWEPGCDAPVGQVGAGLGDLATVPAALDVPGLRQRLKQWKRGRGR